jgi:hypothetical protein
MADFGLSGVHQCQSVVKLCVSQVRQSFPQAMVVAPTELLNAAVCIPDEDDKHLLAAAIMSHADAIVTQNTKHFPAECLEKFEVLCQTPDEFLIHQYYLSPQLVLDKLDDQGAGISQDWSFVIKNLKSCAPEFCELLAANI